MTRALSLGFSPCPNDCFMFDAIVNRRIDLEGLEFAVHRGWIGRASRRCRGTDDAVEVVVGVIVVAVDVLGSHEGVEVDPGRGSVPNSRAVRLPTMPGEGRSRDRHRATARARGATSRTSPGCAVGRGGSR